MLTQLVKVLQMFEQDDPAHRQKINGCFLHFFQ